MRIAVLCPGPSLAAFDEAGAYDAVVAVNRAALAVRADYWVALDCHCRPWFVPQDGPRLVCSASSYRRACRDVPGTARMIHFDPNGLTFPMKVVPWSRWGWAVAVVLAHHLAKTAPEAPGLRRSNLGVQGPGQPSGAANRAVSANVVHCYGMDWDGTADFDGRPDEGTTRGPGRWAREAGLFERLREELARRGTDLERIRLAETGVA